MLPVQYKRPRIFRLRLEYGYMEHTYEYNERIQLYFQQFHTVLENIELSLHYDTKKRILSSCQLGIFHQVPTLTPEGAIGHNCSYV